MIGIITTTGAELQAARKAMKINQTELGKRAGVTRHTISYWECKGSIRHRGGALEAIVRVVLAENLPVYQTSNARAPALGLRMRAMIREEEQRREAQLEKWAQQAEERKSRYRVTCGAKTRKGTPCRCKSEPGKKRCKFHGGMSTGPKTEEGKERIREAQRKRWQSYRITGGELTNTEKQQAT